MQNPFARIAALALAMAFTGTALAQANVINLTMDPAKDLPTIVTQTNQGVMVTFRSIDYVDASHPLDFRIVLPNFVGQYDPGHPNVTACADNTPNTGDVTCVSSKFDQANQPCDIVVPPGPGKYVCREVRLKLSNPTALGPGFSYNVIMEGKVLDPRLRGN